MLGGRTCESFHSSQCLKGILSNIFAPVNNHIITKQGNEKGGLKTLDTSRIKQSSLISGLVPRRPISLDPKLHFYDVSLCLYLINKMHWVLIISIPLLFYLERFHSQPAKPFYVNKWKFLQSETFNSHRIGLEHQHGHHFILDTNMIVYFILDPEKS